MHINNEVRLKFSSSASFLFLSFSFPCPFLSKAKPKVHGTFQYKTGAYVLQMGFAHYDGTPCSQDHLIGEDYAKMKAGPCKKSQNTLEDPRKTMENGAAQTKSEGQNTHMSRIYICTQYSHILAKWPVSLPSALCRGQLAGAFFGASSLGRTVGGRLGPSTTVPWCPC